MSGGSGCPGGVIRFAKAWENESLRLDFLCDGKPGAAVLLVQVCPGPRVGSAKGARC